MRITNEIKFPIYVYMAVFSFLDEKVPWYTSIYHISTRRNRDRGMKRSWKLGRWAISVVAVYRDIPISFRSHRIYTRHDGNFVFPTCLCTFVAFLCLSFSSRRDRNVNSLKSIVRILPRGLKFWHALVSNGEE